MVGIPRVLDTDAEDVIWALQTADALWKRGERTDAIVWLRRAAQSAGEAEDDDRALLLAREAAELSDWVNQSPSDSAARSAPPGAPLPTAAEAVDEFLRQSDAAPPPPEERKFPPPPPKPPAPISTKVPAAKIASSPPPAERVPSAAELHAGMLDPWADPEAPTRDHAATPPPPPKPVPHAPPLPPPVVALAPPPAAGTFDSDEVLTSAPPVVAKSTTPEPPPTPTVAATPTVDLSSVEALSDLPDDAREAFALAATISHLARDEEVSGFALALVIGGSVDLSATIVDASAQRLEAGAILRARGTVGPAASLRLVGAADRSTVAVWDEEAVSAAFRTCPWVEGDLRSAGDRYQALVGVTMGPLGERLDPALRASVTDRLRVQALAEHEVFAARGQAIPGLLVVGAGELELVGSDGVPTGTVIRPGDFLFPNEVLRAAPAPETVRAAAGGALVLVADRAMAQELLVTCPPLLEIFAGA
jgi:hypothetical protein